MEKNIFSNLENLGKYDIKEICLVLQAYNEAKFPDEFIEEDVTIVLDSNNFGNVLLVNSHNQSCAMDLQNNTLYLVQEVL